MGKYCFKFEKGMLFIIPSREKYSLWLHGAYNTKNKLGSFTSTKDAALKANTLLKEHFLQEELSDIPNTLSEWVEIN